MTILRRLALLALALCVVGSFLYLRMRPRPRPETASPEEAVVPPPLPTETPAASDARPTRAELRPLLERLAGGTLEPDERSDPWFAIGDFDGDAATDLAVAVRLRGAPTALADAPFRLQDAAAPGPPPSPAGLAAGERLLAIVHGVAGSAWSDAAAIRPAFLVRHAEGASLRPRPLRALPAEVRMRVTRAHVGDAIAVRREPGGPGGIVFWNGGAYVWADLPDGSAAAVTDDGRSGPP
jgi:hypothetical protein